MFSNRIDLFHLLGFRVSLDLSWFIIAILVVWSLATGYFPWVVPNLETATYWWMGVVGAIGLFASIVVHEFAHALVARRYDLPIAGITLFVFGGIAEMEEEPQTPGAEFWMAIAGPIASLLIAAFFYGLLSLGPQDAMSTPLGAVAAYLALINLIIAVFNMIPAFPLDGGRVLRAALWWWKGDIRWATKIASGLGSILALVLIGIGILNAVGGAFLAGLWQIVLGFFLYGAAGASRGTLELRQALRDLRVSKLMTKEPIVVGPDDSVEDFVENYVYRHHRKFFPVGSGGKALGTIHLSDVTNLERREWANKHVRDLMKPVAPDLVVHPNEPVFQAFKKMQGGQKRLLVMQGEQLVGVITASDIMKYVGIRMQLGEAGETRLAERLPGDAKAQVKQDVKAVSR